MGLHTYGTMAVDWEERIRFDRLREERLARIGGLLADSSLGALLCFDMTNIRYITATHIGTWAQDVAAKIHAELEQRGLLGETVGVDAVEPPVLFALQERGIQVVDGQQLMQRAARDQDNDEIRS